MKRKFPIGLASMLAVGSASGQGLYYTGSEALESLPLKWVVGANAIYDDNVAPGAVDAAGDVSEDDSVALNPYAGLTFVNITPQTTWDIYARLGLIYYLDAPESIDDTNSQSRAGVNLTHRVSERLRLSSRNFISYELEPDYSYGYASTRSTGEYFYWESDNSVGYRWTERLGTYTGLKLTGIDYADFEDNDHFTWEAYNQFRYQLTPQSVLTASYRYSDTTGSGASSDTTDNYLLGGIEHRFNPNTIGILQGGAQFHDTDEGSNNSSPYLEGVINSRVTEQFNVRSFVRYGIENYDTVQGVDIDGNGITDLVEYDDKSTLRIGVSGEYTISPMFAVFGGVDYIPTSYDSGRSDSAISGTVIPEADEDVVNAYVGLSAKFNSYLTATASYNFTDSSSDVVGRDYNRNRISLGLSAEF